MARRLAILALLLPLGLALAGHLRGVDNGFTNRDDPRLILHDPLVAHPLGQGTGALLRTPELAAPIPLTVAVFAAERAAFDLDPGRFHLISLLLHLAVVLAAAGLARRLGASWWAAAAATALFAAHPLTVEPVAWAAGQEDLVATLATLAALWLRAGHHGDSPARTAATGLLVVAAIFASPAALVAPLLVLGIDLCRRRRLLRPASLMLLAVGLAAAATAAALTIARHAGSDPAPGGRLSAAALEQASWGLRLQLEHVFAPRGLLARYYPPTGTELHVGAGLGLGLGLIVAAAATLAWRGGRREAALGLGGALLAYLPVAGLVPLARGPADSALYLPLALATVAVARGFDVFFASSRLRAGLAALTAVTLGAVLALAARTQTLVWHDPLSLWTWNVTGHPGEPRAIDEVGRAIIYLGDFPTALAYYAATATGDYPGYQVSRSEALEALGRPLEAEAALADGARRGDDEAYREQYGFFLVRHPEVEPSDRATAHRALLVVAPLLAARGKHLPSMRRAVALLARLGESAWAERIAARVAEVAARPR